MPKRSFGSPRLFFVVSYDVVDNKIRKKISDTLLDFGGTRVQYSVFECELTKVNYEKLYKKLHKLREADDSIRYYFLCKGCQERMRFDEDIEMRKGVLETRIEIV